MPGLLRGVARTAVIAGTATTVSNRVSRRQANKWAEEDAPAYAAEPAPQQQEQQSAPPPQADRLTQLKELGALKEQGVLSEEEFAAEKARILGT